MDPVMLRNQALNVATMRPPHSVDIHDVLEDAEKVYQWLVSGDVPVITNSASSTHESEAAVVGQEPKGE